MRRPDPLPFEKPTRDALVGIYVEACDEVTLQTNSAHKAENPLLPGHKIPRREELFGITVTLDDGGKGH